MSEYQYYQFQAIDEPLTERQVNELRNISTRAEITSTSFINEYHWGDLKADPLNLMKKYFDAHFYMANWGTRRLMLRTPRDLVDVERARQYSTEESLLIHVHRNHAIFIFESQDEGYDYDDWDTSSGWLPSLIPLREELMRGDLRCLYLGWLAGVWEDDDQDEPPVPPGLRKLSGPLKNLSEFMRIDEHLLKAATDGDEDGPPSGPTQKDMAKWTARLPVKDKDHIVSQLLSGSEEPLRVSSQLQARFRKEWSQSGRRQSAISKRRRTTAQLWQARNSLAERAQRRRAERRAREEAERKKKAIAERQKYLKRLAPQEVKLWREVNSLLRTTNQKSYDQAVAWLQDLRDLADMQATGDEWHERVSELRDQHTRKSSLMKRFDKAGFPE